MNSRIVAALLLAPIACALVFGAWIVWGLERAESRDDRFLFVAFLPGMLYGTLFEVFILLPLLVFLRRVGKGAPGILVACGMSVWAVAVVLNTWATSQLPLTQFSVRDMAMVFLPLMLAGLALVLVFVFIAQSREAA
jgi:hypothetical protein